MSLVLSNARKEIFNFILEFKNQYGFPPSIREICNKVNKKSTATVHRHLKTLEKLGYIKVHKGIRRGIQVLVIPEE